MDPTSSNVLLICTLVTMSIAAVVVFIAVVVVRNKRGTLRRDSGVPIGFGIDASQGNPDSSGTDQLHHHHHHHSPSDSGHHHSHGGADSGGSHHSGGSDGGSVGGGHH